MVSNRRVEYKAKGLVLGKDWSGGETIYLSEEITAKNMKELDKEINKGIKEGWLDKGFGFQYLIGALVMIEKKECFKKRNKWYCNSTYKQKYYGNLTLKQKRFLSEALEDYIL